MFIIIRHMELMPLTSVYDAFGVCFIVTGYASVKAVTFTRCA